MKDNKQTKNFNNQLEVYKYYKGKLLYKKKIISNTKKQNNN